MFEKHRSDKNQYEHALNIRILNDRAVYKSLWHENKAARPQKNFVANNCLSAHSTKKVENIVLFHLIQY